MQLRFHILNLLGFFLACVIPCQGAIDVYLIMERGGVEVETDPVHGWVKVTGFDSGIENTVVIGSTGSTAGKAIGKPITLSLLGDQSVAEMMKATAQGDICTMKLHVVVERTGDGPTVMTELSYTEVLFEKVALSASGGGAGVNFDVTFKYGKMEYVQTLLDDVGKATAVGFGFDFLGDNLTTSGVVDVPQVGSYAGGSDGGGGVDPPISIDSDFDGMPDTWEELHGLDKESAADAILDLDEDGFTNIQEYIAGTDPTSLSSYFRVEAGSEVTGFKLSWNAVEGRVYRVMASRNPTSGFVQVHTVTADSNGVLIFFPDVGAGPFFKLVVGQ